MTCGYCSAQQGLVSVAAGAGRQRAGHETTVNEEDKAQILHRQPPIHACAEQWTRPGQGSSSRCLDFRWRVGALPGPPSAQPARNGAKSNTQLEATTNTALAKYPALAFTGGAAARPGPETNSTYLSLVGATAFSSSWMLYVTSCLKPFFLRMVSTRSATWAASLSAPRFGILA